MPKIAPFRGIHYNPKMITDLAKVITPPYDNIPESELPEYKARSPYNFTHIIMPRKEEVPYTQATSLLEKWREQKILIQDATPSYYLYQQVFKIGESSHSRFTLMAAVKLSDFAEGKVRPHENTHGVHREDRLNILRKTQKNLSHVFAMIKDPEGFLTTLFEPWAFGQALLSTKTQDGIEHGIWQINPEKAKELESFFEERPLYILDGHHRYTSALMYAKELGVLDDDSHPASYMLLAIANCFDPALKVFPTHRVIQDVDFSKFDWKTFERRFQYIPMTEDQLKAFTEKPVDTPQFAMWFQKELHLCMVKDWTPEQEAHGKALGKFSVFWSDEKVLGEILGIQSSERAHKIVYEKSWEPIWEKRNSVPMAIFHAPPAVESITHIADEKSFMPQKSTFFYPKLAAGLVFREVSK